jgi:hypothetical protein
MNSPATSPLAPPFDATFDNGLAQVIGVSWLYTSGSHAWMIEVGQNRCRPNW